MSDDFEDHVNKQVIQIMEEENTNTLTVPLGEWLRRYHENYPEKGKCNSVN